MVIKSSSSKVIDIDLKNCRVSIIDVKFESINGSKVVDFEGVSPIKEGLYLLKY